MKSVPLLKTKSDTVTENVKYLITALFSLLISNVNLLSSMSPFAVAFSAALPLNYSVSAVIGAVTGYGFFGSFPENLVYIASLFAVLGVKSITLQIGRFKGNPLLLSALSAFILGLFLIMRNVILDSGTIDLIFCICESIMGSAFTYFSFFAFRAISYGRKIYDTATVERTSTIIILLTGLLSLCKISVFVFNLGRITAVVILLAIARKKGVSPTSVIGLLFAVILTLHSPEFTLSAGIIAVASMISAYFAHFGKLTQSAFFILTYTVGIMVTNSSTSTIEGAFDMLFGTGIFMVIPEAYLEKIGKTANKYRNLSCSENKRTCSKLLFASKTLNDIHKSVDAVSEKLKNTGITNVSKVYEKTADTVCKRCGLKLFCWETNYNTTLDSFYKFNDILEKNSEITKDDLSAFFNTQCAKPEDIVRTVNGYYHEYLSNKNATRKIMNAKQVAAEQLEGIADMLSEMSEEISETSFINPKLSETAFGIFAELGENPDEVYCITDRYDRMRVEVYKKSRPETNSELLTEELSLALGREFSCPSIVTAEDTTKISFFEKAKYTLDFAAGQINSKNQKISGDCYEYFTDGRGFAHLILSDGMGNGGRAAVDSIMTCNFILKLLKAGFGFNAALKLINSALLVKAGEESLATLDIGCIDLYTGVTRFLKAGASASFVTRNKKTVMVGADSLPVGILQGISYNENEIKLQENDLIVMVTDGAVSITPEWLKDEISLLSELPPKEIATKIATLAKKRNGENDDDITVLAAKIKVV